MLTVIWLSIPLAIASVLKFKPRKSQASGSHLRPVSQDNQNDTKKMVVLVFNACLNGDAQKSLISQVQKKYPGEVQALTFCSRGHERLQNGFVTGPGVTALGLTIDKVNKRKMRTLAKEMSAWASARKFIQLPISNNLHDYFIPSHIFLPGDHQMKPSPKVSSVE